MGKTLTKVIYCFINLVKVLCFINAREEKKVSFRRFFSSVCSILWTRKSFIFFRAQKFSLVIFQILKFIRVWKLITTKTTTQKFEHFLMLMGVYGVSSFFMRVIWTFFAFLLGLNAKRRCKKNKMEIFRPFFSTSIFSLF